MSIRNYTSMDKNESTVVSNTTCFAEHKKRQLSCNKSQCRMWIDENSSHNCCILKAQEVHTLQEIGNLFGVTRMRICQLEKSILKKVQDLSELAEFSG